MFLLSWHILEGTTAIKRQCCRVLKVFPQRPAWPFSTVGPGVEGKDEVGIVVIDGLGWKDRKRAAAKYRIPGQSSRNESSPCESVVTADQLPTVFSLTRFRFRESFPRDEMSLTRVWRSGRKMFAALMQSFHWINLSMPVRL